MSAVLDELLSAEVRDGDWEVKWVTYGPDEALHLTSERDQLRAEVEMLKDRVQDLETLPAESRIVMERDIARDEVERLRADRNTKMIERGQAEADRDSLRALVGDLVEALVAHLPPDGFKYDADLIARAKAAIE